MMERLDISGVHLQVDDDLRKYVHKKVGRLDRYIPKYNRPSAHAEVKLKEAKAKGKKECTCEIVLYLPQEVINVKESTVNMYAAVDIAEAKLKSQLQKYKGLHANPKLHRRLLVRMRRAAE
jgi:ribosomal subunit interface protein